MNAFDDVKRVLTAVLALGLYALNEIRLYNILPRTPDPGNGQTHAITLRLMDGADQAYAGLFDLATRWGLAGLVLACCVWAVAETLPLARAKAERR